MTVAEVGTSRPLTTSQVNRSIIAVRPRGGTVRRADSQRSDHND
ncbi:hypothetical protein HMPREF9056_02528 [Actinomyces sp. oral taxon 170 str. F0386]|nr:hypothetical protein HMPREF9056_02528 [Actinomyces sp. oral taxon 170 str. F0386]